MPIIKWRHSWFYCFLIKLTIEQGDTSSILCSLCSNICINYYSTRLSHNMVCKYLLSISSHFFVLHILNMIRYSFPATFAFLFSSFLPSFYVNWLPLSPSPLQYFYWVEPVSWSSTVTQYLNYILFKEVDGILADVINQVGLYLKPQKTEIYSKITTS